MTIGEREISYKWRKHNRYICGVPTLLGAVARLRGGI